MRVVFVKVPRAGNNDVPAKCEVEVFDLSTLTSVVVSEPKAVDGTAFSVVVVSASEPDGHFINYFNVVITTDEVSLYPVGRKVLLKNVSYSHSGGILENFFTTISPL